AAARSRAPVGDRAAVPGLGTPGGRAMNRLAMILLVAGSVCELRSAPLLGPRGEPETPALQVAAQQTPRISGGNGTFYIGGYPNLIGIMDEATEKVTGTIQLKTGIPRRMTLSRDRTRFYVIDATAEKVEVVDIASRTTLDTFTLTEGNRRIRINSLEPDP